jgi:hypothetical protein
MQDINIKMTADVQQFLEGTKAAKESLTNIKTSNEQLKTSLSTTFEEASKDASSLVGRADAVNKKLGEQSKQLADLIKYQQVLKQLQKETNDPVKAEKYRKELAQTDAVVKSLSSSMKGLGDSTSKLASVGGTLGLSIAAVGVAAVSFGAASLKAAADTEQFRVAFQTLTGSLYEGNKLFDGLIKFAANTPFELPQLQEAAKSLVSFGFTGDETIKTLQSLGDISAGVGQDKLPQLVAALGKVKATTKLTGEALQSFSDAGVPLLQVLADKGKTSTSQIIKDISAGKVSFEDTQKALSSMVDAGGRFFGLMEAQSKTLSGTWSNLQDSIGQLASDFGTLLLPAARFVVGVFSEVVGGVKALVNGFGELTGMSAGTNRELKNNHENFVGLIAVLQNSNTSMATKNQAIAELNQKYPELIGKIDLHVASEKQLNEIIEKSNISLRNQLEIEEKSILLQSKKDKLKELIGKEKQIAGTIGTQQDTSLTASNESKALNRLKAIKEGQVKDLSSQTSSLEAEALKLQEEIAALELQGAISPIKTTGGVVDDAAGKKYAADLKKIKEDLSKRVREIDEQDRLESKKNLDKDVEELQIALENRLKIYADYEKKLGKDKEATALRGQINEIIIRETKETEEAIARKKAEYLIKDIEMQQEKIALIEKFTLKGQALEEAQAVRELQTNIDKLKSLKATTEEMEVVYAAHFKKINEIEVKYATEKLSLSQSADLGEIPILKRQLQEIEKVNEEKFFSQKHSDEQIDAFKVKQGLIRERNALLVNKRELEINLFYQQKIAELSGDTTKVDALTQQLKEIDSLIAISDKGISNPLDKGKNKKSQNIFEALGFEGATADILNDATNQIVSSIQQINAAQLDAADKSVEAAQRRVQASEDALDREIELAKLGYANDVGLKQQQLEDSKVAEREALERRKKVALQQLAIDSAMQISGISLAAVNLYKTWSTIPFGLGIIPAAAQVIGLIAAVSSIRSRAKSISEGYFEKGGEGRVGRDGVVVGNRHSDGGVPLEVEGGEFFATDGKRFSVVNRAMTSKHYSLLDAINRDDRGAMKSYLSSMVGLDRSAPERFDNSRRESESSNMGVAELRESNALLRKILHATNSSSQVTDLGDRVRVKTGSKIVTIKKS